MIKVEVVINSSNVEDFTLVPVVVFVLQSPICTTCCYCCYSNTAVCCVNCNRTTRIV